QPAHFTLTIRPPPDTKALPLPDALPISPRSLAMTLPQIRPTPEPVPLPVPPVRSGHPPALTVLAVIAVIVASTVSAGGCPLRTRSEEHTSELQSRGHLVCRLLLEKKKEA